MKLSPSARKKATVGEMTNLIAVNANSIAEILFLLNWIWVAPSQMIIVVYMLWQYLGVSSLVGVAVMAIFIPINSHLAKISKKIQVKKLKFQDSRIKTMNEILSGMKVIKFYGWEESFQNIILKIRTKELIFLKKMGLLNVASIFTFQCAPLLVATLTFVCFVLIDKNNVLTANNTFVSLALFNILKLPMGLLPMVISSLVNVSTYIAFLTYETRKLLFLRKYVKIVNV